MKDIAVYRYPSTYAHEHGELELYRASQKANLACKEAIEAVRTAITWLEPRNEIGRSIFTKQPEPLKTDQTYRYQHQPVDLLKALDMIAERNSRQLPPPTVNFKGIVGKEPYPVTKKAGEVLRQLVLRGTERLKNLFRGNRSRSEIVATFLAVLELCSMGSVLLSREGEDYRISFAGGELDEILEKIVE